MKRLLCQIVHSTAFRGLALHLQLSPPTHLIILTHTNNPNHISNFNSSRNNSNSIISIIAKTWSSRLSTQSSLIIRWAQYHPPKSWAHRWCPLPSWTSRWCRVIQITQAPVSTFHNNKNLKMKMRISSMQSLMQILQPMFPPSRIAWMYWNLKETSSSLSCQKLLPAPFLEKIRS